MIWRDLSDVGPAKSVGEVYENAQPGNYHEPAVSELGGRDRLSVFRVGMAVISTVNSPVGGKCCRV